MMTLEEYENRPRFPLPDIEDYDKFYSNLRLNVGTMFEIYTLQNHIIFAKITDTFANILFDVKQCNEAGEIVRNPLYANGVNKTEIADKILEGDWRIFTTINPE